MGSHYEGGRYSATIRSQGFARSKEKLTPFFYLEIEPFEALDANQLPETIYTRRIEMYLSEKAKKYSFEKLRSLGWDSDRLADLDPDNPHHISFVNAIVTVVNNPDGDYDKFDLLREGAGIVNESGLAAKLDKLYGKSIANDALKQGATQRPKAGPSTKAERDEAAVAAGFPPDEIPF